MKAALPILIRFTFFHDCKILIKEKPCFLKKNNSDSIGKFHFQMEMCPKYTDAPRSKIKFCLFAIAYLPTKILSTQTIFLTTWDFFFFFFFFLNGKFTMITLNSRTNRPEQKSADPDQTAPRRSDLGLHCLPFHLHFSGTPFVGKIDLIKLYDVVVISEY